MKKFTLLTIIFFAKTIVCYSQLPSNYPFKSIIDNNGDIYVTGDSLNPANNTLDFVVIKFVNGVAEWRTTINNPYGEDKGMDLVINNDPLNPFVYATGYTKTTSRGYEIYTLKLNATNGNLLWSKKYRTYEDCRGFAIALDIAGNPYVTGFSTTNGMKEIVTIKYTYEFGILAWSKTYSNPLFTGNDVGTDILVDSSYVYVMGSTYNGPNFGNDIVLLNYTLSGDSLEVDMYKSKADEIPTSFVIAALAKKTDKSRISLTSVSDFSGNPQQPMSSYLTVAFSGGRDLDLDWANTFKRNALGENIATSIDSDESGNLYVTGYSQSNETGLDYATIKYKPNGTHGWPGKDSVLFYDMSNGTDMASSVKVYHDSVYVTGSSQLNPGGYRTVAYTQGSNGSVKYAWGSSFQPSFGDQRDAKGKAATLNIDTTTGNLIVMAMIWGESIESKYAIRGYSSGGSILYTIDYNQDPDNIIKTEDSIDKIKNYRNQLSQNYPNPFNPVTKINYQLTNTKHVSIKIYSLLGNEVAVLLNEVQKAGTHSVSFDGSNLSSGIYYYKIISGEYEEIKRMILIK